MFGLTQRDVIVPKNYSVESNCGENSGENETATQQIVWNHSKREDFLK